MATYLKAYTLSQPSALDRKATVFGAKLAIAALVGWWWNDGGGGQVMHRSWFELGEQLFVAMVTEALFTLYDRTSGGGLAGFSHAMLKGASDRMRLSREKAKSKQTDVVPSGLP